MTDIVDRLRLLPATVVAHDGWIRHEGMLELASAAAAEIERLRLEIETLDDVIRDMKMDITAQQRAAAIRARGSRHDP